METLTHRYFVKIKLEALTPLVVGSGDSSLLVDALVQKDHLGLPMIPGTAIAGVLRHALQKEDSNVNEEKLNDVFGIKDESGSRILFSHAYMLLSDQKVAEGIDVEIDETLKNKLDFLPTRQHVNINDKGTAIEDNLFNNEVVYKGISFITTIELKGNEEDKDFWNSLLFELQQPLFRLGQGTRNGYGNLKAHILERSVFDLTKEEDFESYLKLSPSLQLNMNSENPNLKTEEPKNKNITHYSLTLHPDNLIDGSTNFSTFIFGGEDIDSDADTLTKSEEIMEYDENNQIKFSKRWLIPGTSIKGAISHRVSYYYNRWMIENKRSEERNLVKTDNEAVYTLFGAENNMQIDKTRRKIERKGRKGILLIDDIYLKIGKEKIFNHVAIDRFTGGAINGALFSEKVAVHDKNSDQIVINIYLENHKLLNTSEEKKSKIIDALEKTLMDICKGYLPLGGMTTKGHGFFNGGFEKDNEILYPQSK